MSWDSKPIKDLYLGLYDGPHATPPPAGEGPVFLGIKNITEDGFLDFNEIRHIAADDFPKWTRRVVPQPGDIVFSYEATLNRYALVPSGFLGCLGRRLALVRPDPAAIEPRYLYYYFFSDAWRRVIAANTLIGATVDRVPLTDFPDFPVLVPSPENQNLVVRRLEAYDSLVENLRRRIVVLWELAATLYRHRFDAIGEADSLPRGWAVDRLGNHVELAYGKALTAQNRNGGDVPVFGSSGVVGWHDESLVPGPGIIVGRKGNVGSVHWTADSFWPIDTVFYVNTDLPLSYVFFNLSGQGFIDSDAAVPGLNREQAYSLDLVVPSPAALDEFDSRCWPLMKLVANLEQQLARVREMRTMVLRAEFLEGLPPATDTPPSALVA